MMHKARNSDLDSSSMMPSGRISSSLMPNKITTQSSFESESLTSEENAKHAGRSKEKKKKPKKGE